MFLDVAGHALSVPGVLALGVVVGYVAGMFGVGGGFLLTPLLNVVFRVPLEIAVGTGLCQMIGTGLVSLLRHRSLGQGELRFDILMLAGGFIGVDAGARILAALSALGAASVNGHAIPIVNLVIEPMYMLLLLGAAAMFWFQRGGATSTGGLARIRFGPTVSLPAVGLEVSAILVAYIGFGLGLLSGLLGLGGGIALMPILIYGFGFPIKQAAGTGILLLVGTASFGTFVHALRGNVDLRLALLLLVGASVSAQFGASATRRMEPTKLRRGFALVVVVTVVAVAWDVVRRVAA